MSGRDDVLTAADVSRQNQSEQAVLRSEIARLRALNAELAWTAEKPTKSGWYWLTGDGWAEDSVIVWVEVYPDLLNPVRILWASSYSAIPRNAQWAGPILKPASKPTD